MPRYLHRDAEGGLTRREALAVVGGLEELAAQLERAAGYLADHEEPRAASYLLAGLRDVLAAAFVVRPASEHELAAVVEQLPPREPPRPPDREQTLPSWRDRRG